MKRLSGKLVASGFGLALLMLGGTAVESYLNARKLTESRQLVEHTHQVLETLSQILNGMNNAERGRRGYLLLKDDRELETLRLGAQTMTRAVIDLRQLTHDNPTQQRRLDELEPLIDQRLALLQQFVDLKQQINANQNSRVAILKQTISLQQEIEARLQTMEAEERLLLQKRSDATDASAQQAILIASIGYVLSFCLLVGVFFVLQKQIRSRQQAEVALQQANDKLETKVQERTAELSQVNALLRGELIERKQAERALAESEKQIRLITDALPVLISYVDSERRYRFSNRAYEQWFGYSRAEINGQHISQILGESAYQAIAPYADIVLAGQDVTYERLLPYKDGGARWINAIYLPDFGEQGIVRGYFALISDITDRKQAEQALQQMNEALETKVQERTVALKHLNDDLMRSNQELEQFAYIASHDLQEPLRAITGYTQLLVQDYHDRLDESAQEYADYIVDGAKRMQQLIQDLLLYSRVGTRELIFAPTDCNTILSQVLHTLQAAIAESNAVITHDPLPIVAVDKMQLAQLFQNLIGNAIKFCRERSPHIHISATKSEVAANRDELELSTELSTLIPAQTFLAPDALAIAHQHGDTTAQPETKDSGSQETVLPLATLTSERVETPLSMAAKQATTEWVFAVRDNGIGIKPRYLERIFEIFKRLHTRTEFPGTGIGLAICKKIVDRHHGRIWAESEPGAGTTFYFTFPHHEHSDTQLDRDPAD